MHGSNTGKRVGPTWAYLPTSLAPWQKWHNTATGKWRGDESVQAQTTGVAGATR